MGNIVEAIGELYEKELVGVELKNKAIVVKAGHLYDTEFKVIAIRKHPVNPYVVWNTNCDLLEPYKGDYCATLEEALTYYNNR